LKTSFAALAVLTALAGACREEPRKALVPPSAPIARPSAPVAAGNRLNVLLITIDTLRPDHLGTYGYRRATSPHIDAFARDAAVFDQAYTHWPKTRGSFVMMMTGRRASQNGYSKSHPFLLGFNSTLASTLHDGGYATAAAVDNANVDSELGYSKGFERYRETWTEKELVTEMDKSRAITEEAAAFLAKPPADRPFFLWLHYVNPHAPYTPPPPFDTRFLDADSAKGPVLAPIDGGFHGGVNKKWEVPGKRLGYYVAQYDGEIAAADQEVGRVLDALAASAAAGRTLVVLTSDHGESLGEHGYYFDHGEDVFDACLRIPLVIKLPGAPGGIRTATLASTLDLLPTILDAVKMSYPPDIAGRSVLAAVRGAGGPENARLFAQNDRSLTTTFDERFKLVGTPTKDAWSFSLYDRKADPREARDATASQPDALRVNRRELELFFDRTAREWGPTRRLTEGDNAKPKLSAEACERIKVLGYVDAGCS
jgi:arylsulfatase A-like enzyme